MEAKIFMLLSRILSPTCIPRTPPPLLETEFHSVFQTRLNSVGGLFAGCLACYICPGIWTLVLRLGLLTTERLSSLLTSLLCHHTWLKIYFDMEKNVRWGCFKRWLVSSVEVFTMCLHTHWSWAGLEGDRHPCCFRTTIHRLNTEVSRAPCLFSGRTVLLNVLCHGACSCFAL